MQLPHAVLYLIDKLAHAGFRADVVGGCVRDMLRGVSPHDFDLTTDATPQEMKRVFKNDRVIETGIRHGTLTVLVDRVAYEITTYRIEGGYTDNRHPSEVTFTRTLTEDLSRRDFTMNAICYHPRYGYTDPFFGMRDIRDGVIRCVGEPVRRFEEDGLRILRALRFSSVLGYALSADTAAAVHTCRALLSNISAERVYVEWKKLLGGDGAARVLSDHAEVIAVRIPELRAVLARPLLDLSRLNSTERNVLLFALLGEEGRACFSRVMSRLKTDRAARVQGERILEELHFSDDGRDGSLLRLLYRIGAQDAQMLLRLRTTMGIGTVADEDRLANVLARGAIYRIADLCIGGEVPVARGLRGAAIARTLENILFAIMDGKIKNTESEILDFLASDDDI